MPKTIIITVLLLTSTSLLAQGQRPLCGEYEHPNLGDDCRPAGGGGGASFAPGNNAASIPEPGTFALIAMGMAGLVVARRRKR